MGNSNTKLLKYLAKPGGHGYQLLTGLAIVMLSLAGCASRPEQRVTASSAAPPSAPLAPASAATPSAATAPTAPQAPAVAPVEAQSEPVKHPLPPGFSALPAPFEGIGWQDMFDGETLNGWRETPFAGHAEIQCHDGAIWLGMGEPFTGVSYTNALPNMNYEIALDAMRVMGSDFFCGLTVPVGESHCSLIVGGWGGSLFGISSLDGMDASENETTKFITFETGRWYRLRIRVTQKRIEAWVDKEKLINVNTEGRRISLRAGDIELSKPMGIASWQTASALREIKYRKVEGPEGPPKKGD